MAKRYSGWYLDRVAIPGVFQLDIGETTLGRTPDSTIYLTTTWASREHCRFDISKSNGVITLTDFSQNGTFVNDEHCHHASRELEENDKIGIGCLANYEMCATGIYYVYELKKDPEVYNRNWNDRNEIEIDSDNLSCDEAIKENDKVLIKKGSNSSESSADSKNTSRNSISDDDNPKSVKPQSDNEVTINPSRSGKKSIHGSNGKNKRYVRITMTSSDSSSEEEDSEPSIPKKCKTYIEEESEASLNKSLKSKKKEETGSKEPAKLQAERRISTGRNSTLMEEDIRKSKPAIPSRRKSNVKEENESSLNKSLNAEKTTKTGSKEPVKLQAERRISTRRNSTLMEDDIRKSKPAIPSRRKSNVKEENEASLNKSLHAEKTTKTGSKEPVKLQAERRISTRRNSTLMEEDIRKSKPAIPSRRKSIVKEENEASLNKSLNAENTTKTGSKEPVKLQAERRISTRRNSTLMEEDIRKSKPAIPSRRKSNVKEENEASLNKSLHAEKTTKTGSKEPVKLQAERRISTRRNSTLMEEDIRKSKPAIPSRRKSNVKEENEASLNKSLNAENTTKTGSKEPVKLQAERRISTRRNSTLMEEDIRKSKPEITTKRKSSVIDENAAFLTKPLNTEKKPKTDPTKLNQIDIFEQLSTKRKSIDTTKDYFIALNDYNSPTKNAPQRRLSVSIPRAKGVLSRRKSVCTSETHLIASKQILESDPEFTNGDWLSKDIPKRKASTCSVDDEFPLIDLTSDDQDEYLSQSLVRDMKQEIIDFECEEPYVYQNDNDILISDEDSEDYYDESVADWAFKLSQTSVKEESNKLPITKQIRKVPEIITPPCLPTTKGKLRGVSANPSPKLLAIAGPSKRGRGKASEWLQKTSPKQAKEQSMQIQANRKAKLKELAAQTNKRKLSDDDDVKIVKVPKVKNTLRNRGAFLVEQLQPEPISKTSPSTTNNNVQRRNTLRSRKPTITSETSDCSTRECDSENIPLKSENTIPTPILKKSNSRKTKKNVTFNLTPQIKYFISENTSGRKVDKKDANIDLSNFVIQKKVLVPKIDYTDIWIAEILSWKPNWLKNGTEKVNGSKHPLMPLLHHFSSFDEYRKILSSLMKVELWECIKKDYIGRRTTFVSLRVDSFEFEKRKNYTCYIYNCNCFATEMKNVPFNIGELCIVAAEQRGKFMELFAYVENIRKIEKNYYQIVLISSVDINFKRLIEVKKFIKARSIYHIRVDLGSFDALENLKTSPLLKIILNPKALTKSTNVHLDYSYKGYEQLNDNQKQILFQTYANCINSSEHNITLIEGPPGTGKSRLICNLALQIIYGLEVKNAGKTILICAQSNTAIDGIVLKLAKIRSKMSRDKFRLVRYGLFERMHPDVRCVSSQHQVDANLRRQNPRLDSLRNERALLQSKLKKLSQNNPSGIILDEIQNIRKTIDMIIKKEYSEYTPEDAEKQLQKQLRGAQIVCTTLSSAIKLLQYRQHFDICIIDEATQCVEPYTLIPLQFNISSLVLVGDTRQLPATVLSQETNKCGFGQSLFTRIQKCLEFTADNPILHLCNQYRMHPEICKWPNEYFYGNRLINEKSTYDYQIKVRPYAIFNLVYDQNSSSSPWQVENPLEAKFVLDLLKHMDTYLPRSTYSYGVITPYSQHRDKLNEAIRDSKIENVIVQTVDSYQGTEKDVIIISNARTKGIGFLNISQRLNVALTRAKRCLILCGNFTNVMNVPVWKSLLEDAKKRGVYFHISKRDATYFEKTVMRHLIVNAEHGNQLS